MSADQAIIIELQEMNANLLALLEERSVPSPSPEFPGLANEAAENLDLVHVYRTQGLDVFLAECKQVMRARKQRMFRSVSGRR